MKTFWSLDMHWQIQMSTRRYDKKGHPKHSANARVNSISKWIEGYCDIICLYFIILFSGLFYKQLEFHRVNQGGVFPGYSALFAQATAPSLDSFIVIFLDEADRF